MLWNIMNLIPEDCVLLTLWQWNVRGSMTEALQNKFHKEKSDVKEQSLEQQ